MDNPTQYTDTLARKYMIDLIEKYFPSGILPDPYKDKDIHTMEDRELEELYKDVFQLKTDEWHFKK